MADPSYRPPRLVDQHTLDDRRTVCLACPLRDEDLETCTICDCRIHYALSPDTLIARARAHCPHMPPKW